MSLFSPSRKALNFLVFQHSDNAPCGNFCKALSERGANIHLVKLCDDEPFPESPLDFAGLVVLGGPQNAWDDEQWPHFVHLMELMRQYDAAGKPVVGICLGSQILSRAHGGSVHRMGSLEFGFIHHQLTEAGKKDPVVGGIELPALMGFHQDASDVPPEGTLLIKGDTCPCQCFKVGNASYGFQFHLEVDLQIAMKWIHLLRSGQIEHYRCYADQFNEDFFNDMLSRINTYAEESEKFCNTVAERIAMLCNQEQ